MEGLSVVSAMMGLVQPMVYCLTRGPNMKVWSMSVTIVTIAIMIKVIWLDTNSPKHEGVRYECDECDYKAITRGYLTTHKQSIHEGLRYECDECDNKFITRISLARHKQSIHEGVRYECNECGLQSYYSWKSDHTQTVHTWRTKVWMWWVWPQSY